MPDRRLIYVKAKSPVLIDSAAENTLYRRISYAEFLVGTGGAECRLVDDRRLTQKAELPALIKIGLPGGPQQQRPPEVFGK